MLTDLDVKADEEAEGSKYKVGELQLEQLECFDGEIDLAWSYGCINTSKLILYVSASYHIA